MGYYYVTDTGASTTPGGTTKQTGAFSGLPATAVYASVQSAITYGASDGDIICISDADTRPVATANVAIAGGTTTALHVCTVTDAACETLSSSAAELASTTGTAYDVLVNGLITMTNVNMTSGDLIELDSSTSHIIMNNGKITIEGAINYIYAGGDGNYLELNDTDIDFQKSTQHLLWQSGSVFVWNGGAALSSVDGTLADLCQRGAINGGYAAKITGVDLSIVTDYLVAQVGGALGVDDAIKVHIDKCKLNASLTAFNEETFTNKFHKLLVTNSSSSSSAAEYQYYYHSRGGTLEDDTTFYRDNSTAFVDSNQKVSLKCTTDSNAELACPFTFQFPSVFAELSVATTDTLRIYILSATALTDADVWVEIFYPDGTNNQTFNLAQSVTNPTNPMRTGTTLTTNTEAWTGRTTENRYQIDIATSGDVGADCVPTINVSVAKASSTIYFCTTVNVVA